MKKIFMLMVIIGTFMLFGTAGASDVGYIAVPEALNHGLAAIAFLFTGFCGMLMCHMDEVHARRQRKLKEMKRRRMQQRTYVYTAGKAA